MLRSILVGLDGSEHSDSALGLALRWASRYDALLVGIGCIDEPGDVCLRIAQAVGADEYINPPGGADLYDPAKFRGSGIELTIQRFVEFAYPTPGFDFVPALSIIDVCMWNAPERIKAFLDAYRYEDLAA